jgi:DNA mismatch repair protein PMS2
LSSKYTNTLSQDLQLDLQKSDFLELGLIGQFNKGFIITQKDGSLFIIDQHAADEKYLFETFQATTQILKQPLLVPKELVLSSYDESLLEQYQEAIRLNGFILNYEETNPLGHKFYLASVPVSKSAVLGEAELLEMIENLKTVGCIDDINQLAKLIRPKKYYDMFASRACRKAVMIGTAIEPKKMTQIVAKLAGLEHPWNCPHGRPTVRLLKHLPRLASNLPQIKYKLN